MQKADGRLSLIFQQIQTLLNTCGSEASSSGLMIMAMSNDLIALVVDDDAIIMLGACDILERAGFRSYEATTGDDAIALLDAHADNVTLLFSDVEMPGHTNGFRLAMHVAQHWPWIEIVIASGCAEPSAGDLPAKASFIQKPYNEKTILDHLRQTLPEAKKPVPLKQAL